jgi:hypothetical protein
MVMLQAQAMVMDRNHADDGTRCIYLILVTVRQPTKWAASQSTQPDRNPRRMATPYQPSRHFSCIGKTFTPGAKVQRALR